MKVVYSAGSQAAEKGKRRTRNDPKGKGKGRGERALPRAL